MNPTASNFSTSTWMNFCLSEWKHWTFWQIGREDGTTLSRYEAIDGWMDFGHIEMGPCEDTFIMLKYLYESSYFFRREEWAKIGEVIIFF